MLKKGRTNKNTHQRKRVLYNMVRIIAGTLVEVGRGAFAPSEVKEMLEQKKEAERELLRRRKVLSF